MIGETILYCRITEGAVKRLWRNAVIKMLEALLLCGCLVGCGSSSAANLNGSWHFTLKSSADGNTYNGTASITQSKQPVNTTGAGSLEHMLTGVLKFTANPCATAAPMSGTITVSSVILTITEDGQPVSLTGSANATFTAMSGSYTAPFGGCTGGDFGSWTASKS